MTTFFKNITNPFQSGDTEISAETTVDQLVTDPFVRRVNMSEYGFEQSGAHRGDAQALANLFRQILNGRFIDENANVEQQQKHRDALNDQILELEKQAESILSDQRKIREVQIPEAQAQIEQYDNHVLQIRKDEAMGLYKPGAINRFSLWKLGTATVLCGLYLICFYISAVYSGMIRNIAGELANSSGNMDTLFANIFVPGAFSELNFHWIAPILLLSFAVVLDIFQTSLKGLTRIVCMTTAIVITLWLDALIAYKIEEKSQQIKAMMGLADPDHHWWSSADFYIVVLMGFVATLVWGIIFIAYKQELAKTDGYRVVALDIAHCTGLKAKMNTFIFELKGRMADLEGKMAQLVLNIKQLRDRHRTLAVSKAELEKSINDFYNGWLAYLNGLGNRETVKQECEAVLQRFYQEQIADSDPVPS